MSAPTPRPPAGSSLPAEQIAEVKRRAEVAIYYAQTDEEVTALAALAAACTPAFVLALVGMVESRAEDAARLEHLRAQGFLTAGSLCRPGYLGAGICSLDELRAKIDDDREFVDACEFTTAQAPAARASAAPTEGGPDA